MGSGFKIGFRRGTAAVLTFAAMILISSFFYWMHPDFWVAAGMGPAAVYCVVVTFRYTRARDALARLIATCRVEPPDLSKQTGREALEAMLIGQSVTGDANIRAGRVYRIVHPRDLPDIVKKMQSLIAGLSDGRLPVPYNLYRAVGRPGLGWTYETVDLSLCDLAEMASVLERVAEDRRQSVQLYSGITEDEIMGIARTVAASRLRRSGEADGFEVAAAVLAGKADDHPYVVVARATVDLIYKIKGAKL